MYIKKSVGGTESIVEISGAGGAEAIFVEYLYTATASQTAFSGNDDNSAFLSYEVGAIQVFLNGILLDPETDYTATNGALITLASAAAVDDYLQIFAFKKKISDGNVTVDAFSGNNSTTAFTLTLDPGDENNTRVFIDGVYQSKSNYTVSGTTLTFSTAPPSGTAIEVEIGNRVVTLDTLSDLDLPDNVKLRLGTSQDLEIYHNATDSVINQTGTGDLLIQKDETTVAEFNVEGLTVTGSVEADEFIGDVRGAVLFKAQAGESLAKGEVVYISGISGNTTIVSKADADDASKMPAFGLVAAAASSGNPVDIYTNGILSGIDTSSYSEGDELFVSTTAGALTATPPTGESSALQKIGKVTRSASNGSIFIVGAGRSNAVSNLDDGDIFIGNSSNQAVSASLNTKIESYLDGGTSTPTFSTINSGNITTTGELRGPASFTIDPAAVGDNTGTVIIKGNLQVDGATTTINSTTLTVDDLNLTLASGAANGTAADGAGITIDGASATLTYQSTGDNWAFNKNLDVTGSVTADGLTVDASTASMITFNHSTPSNLTTIGQDSSGDFRVRSDNVNKLKSYANGDFELYEDTGTTAKLFWDASAERLGIGTSSPARALHVVGTGRPAEFGSDNLTNYVKLYNSATGNGTYNGLDLLVNSTSNSQINAYGMPLTFGTSASNGTNVTERMRINSSGTVGIGTTNALYKLVVSNAGASGIEFGPAYSGTTNLVQHYNRSGASYVDVNTSAAQHKFYIGATFAAIIDASGNVGIGTSSPDKSLHVYHATINRPALIESGDADSLIEFKDSSTTNAPAIGATGNNLVVQTGSSATERMRIDSSGNVGIGSTPSSHRLEVKGVNNIAKFYSDSAATELKIASPTVNVIGLYTGTSDALTFGTADTERMRIDSAGQVGIGNISPTQTLEIHNSATGDYTDFGLRGTGHKYVIGVGNDAVATVNDKWYLYDNDNGAFRMVVDTAGNVGIGTSSPSSFHANANNLVVGSGSGTEGITINSGAANYGVIYFADGTSGSAAYAGNINYNHDDNSMRLGTNGSTTDVVIDSSGRVGINRTPTIANSKLEVGGADNVSLINVEASGNTGGMGIGSTGLQFFHGSSSKLAIASSGAATFASSITSAGVTSSNSITMNAGNLTLNSTSDGNQAFRYYRADGTLVSQQYPYNSRINFQTYNNQGLRLKSHGTGQIELEGNVVINEDGADMDLPRRV